MSEVIQNDWRRTWAKKARYIMMVFLMAAVVCLAFYLNQKGESELRVGVVGEEIHLPKIKQVKWIVMQNEPVLSKMIMGEYDAVLSKKEASYQLQTLKDETRSEDLGSLLKHYTEKINGKKQGTAERIIGYLMMFLLMMGLTNLAVFSEDKEKQIFKRLATTPTSFGKIILGHGIFSISSLFFPVMLILYGGKWLFHAEMGLDFWQYSSLILLITLFATGFAIFIISMFRKGDQANMTGSLVLVITTLLSGSFISLESPRKWLNTLIQIMPQKHFLMLVSEMENGNGGEIGGHLFYLLFLTVLFFSLGVYLIRKDIQEN